MLFTVAKFSACGEIVDFGGGGFVPVNGKNLMIFGYEEGGGRKGERGYLGGRMRGRNSVQAWELMNENYGSMQEFVWVVCVFCVPDSTQLQITYIA